jgi:hypothetical protein
MQQRAGLLFLSKSTGRVLLILEEEKWTVPTFIKDGAVIPCAEDLMANYARGRILPIELYVSADSGFEYGTYVCLVEQEFITMVSSTFCWAKLDSLPKQIHAGLKYTLNNSITKTKLETILVITNDSKNTE